MQKKLIEIIEQLKQETNLSFDNEEFCKELNKRLSEVVTKQDLKTLSYAQLIDKYDLGLDPNLKQPKQLKLFGEEDD